MVERVNSSGWATYLRVSDEDKQSPERSFAMQRQRINERLIEPSGLPFIHEYKDKLTGTNPNRKDYQQLLLDAEAGKFSHLGLYRSDRFGRDRVEGLITSEKLIEIGIKIRMASMPGLMPETPDGDFLFYLQVGLAQREIQILKQRTSDGMEAKLRKGGWAHKAPDGYINKEQLISSGKYERWVEQDPGSISGIRTAWELLLTDRYTLDQICEELTRLGLVRKSGLPWAWNDPKNGKRKTARNCLQRVFHKPFYAGWVTSKRFGIVKGEVRGKWEPVVTDEQFEQGKQILLKHGDNKTNFKKRFYLLRNLLWVQANGKILKMYGSTPSGSKKSISYYRTNTEIEGKRFRIQCKVVDDQVPGWVNWVMIDPDLVPSIRDKYKSEIKNRTQNDKENEIAKLKKRLDSLENEDGRLARIFMSGKINEKVYDQLRDEWQEKTRQIKATLKELEFDASKYLDDLDVALLLFANISTLYQRIKEKKRTELLQVLLKRFIIDRDGEIISFELHSPFTYLFSLASQAKAEKSKDGGCSTSVSVSTPTATRTQVSTSGG